MSRKKQQNYDAIPQELKNMSNWVCWSGDKLPRNPHTNGAATPNNPKTWSTFDVAIKAVETFNLSGIGFMFTAPYFGVDLNNSVDNVDLIDEFYDTLGSYAEVTKSQTGIHFICKGEVPKGSKKQKNIEIYSEKRFFIMTGISYREPLEIAECSETIKILHSKYLGEKSIAQEDYEKLNLTDDDVIQAARNSKNRAYFEALYQGEWQGGYEHQSDADLAFCRMLAFWTQRDYTQIDRIFRTSKLYRSK